MKTKINQILIERKIEDFINGKKKHLTLILMKKKKY